MISRYMFLAIHYSVSLLNDVEDGSGGHDSSK
jgi:hypothetical protein